MDREDNSEKETTHSLKLQAYESGKSELLHFCYSFCYSFPAFHVKVTKARALRGVTFRVFFTPRSIIDEG